MLIHVVSRLFEPAAAVDSEIYDISIPECGMLLLGGKDITARRPYPNKRYLVACRKTGKKAINGFLLEVNSYLTAYTVITRWVVDGEIITHVVKHEILDRDFDTVSDNMILWYGTGDGRFQPRWPASYAGDTTLARQPRMDILESSVCSANRPPEVRDVIVQDNRIQLRVENFKLHTLELERIHDNLFDHELRTPDIQDAFKALVTDVPRLSITLNNSLTADILLVPMPQKNSSGDYPKLVDGLAPMIPDVYLNFIRNNEVLAEFIPWGEVISGRETVVINPSLTLDAEDIYKIDLEGWELMMALGMFPTEFVM